MVRNLISLPDVVWHGIELINQQKYFEAHEVLEFAWRAEPKPIRRLYQGLLQAGVGYLHIYRKNFSGATKSFSHAHRNLAEWIDNPNLPFDLKDISNQLNQAEDWIHQGGNGKIRPIHIQVE